MPFSRRIVLRDGSTSACVEVRMLVASLCELRGSSSRNVGLGCVALALSYYDSLANVVEQSPHLAP